MTEKMTPKPPYDLPISVLSSCPFSFVFNCCEKSWLMLLKVACMDLLVPGVGELIGGSQREERYDVLKNQVGPSACILIAQL